MTEESFKRKLAAILSADVEGYSRLMGQNEERTIRTLTSYRTAISEIIQQYRGRVVDTPGDNILAEFGSVVDAVKSAVKIQTELFERNAELPTEQRMQFRIGVNIGDVVDEEGRIYGDGINIAARVESMAEAGGICITGRVYDQVENKLDCKYEYLGEKKVKNISRPIRVYNLLMRAESSSDAASEERMAFPLPDKPSIAVLSFDNMSGDPEQEYIGDGISESIISALAISPDMLVIARNSTFVYKGKPVKVQQIAEDLGVRYILEGSFLTAGNRIRITAQLVDALSGHHAWTEQYDREMQDFFDLLDDISKQITIELQVELTSGDTLRSISQTRNFKAWANNVKGLRYFFKVTEENNMQARKYFEIAIKLDPDFAGAIAMLVNTYLMSVVWGWSKSPLEDFKRCEELTQKAKELDENLSIVYIAAAYLQLFKLDHKKSIEEAKRAITLGPNDPWNYAALAFAKYYNGNFQEAVSLCEKIERLSPYRPSIYLMAMGLSYRGIGRYDEAIAIFNDLLDRAQKGEFNPLLAHQYLTPTYAMQGNMSKARFHAAELLKINPNYSIDNYRTANFHKNPKHFEPYIDMLLKLGIPDTPPKSDSM
ncbi:MAG: adenylate/guanylate cyclase domain-containing protein [Nitrospinales bacterium]